MAEVTNLLDPVVRVDRTLAFECFKILPHVLRNVREDAAERDRGRTLVCEPIVAVVFRRSIEIIASHGSTLWLELPRFRGQSTFRESGGFSVGLLEVDG